MEYLGNKNLANVVNGGFKNVSFRGSEVQEPDFKVITDEEFAESKEKVINKVVYILSNCDGDFQYVRNVAASVSTIPDPVGNRARLIYKILSDERLSRDVDVLNQAISVVDLADTPEKAQLSNKILSDERLSRDVEVLDQARDIVDLADTPEKAQIADKLLSIEELFVSFPESIMNVAGVVSRAVETPEQFQLANKLLSDKRLYENTKVISFYMERIINSANTPERAQIKSDLLDTILSDERLSENPVPKLMEIAASVIDHANTPEQAQMELDLLDRILSSERLSKDPEFTELANSARYGGYVVNPEIAKIKLDLLDRINLSDHPEFMKDPYKILADGYTLERAKEIYERYIN